METIDHAFHRYFRQVIVKSDRVDGWKVKTLVSKTQTQNLFPPYTTGHPQTTASHPPTRVVHHLFIVYRTLYPFACCRETTATRMKI